LEEQTIDPCLPNWSASNPYGNIQVLCFDFISMFYLKGSSDDISSCNYPNLQVINNHQLRTGRGMIKKDNEREITYQLAISINNWKSTIFCFKQQPIFDRAIQNCHCLAAATRKDGRNSNKE
jgi:hypothetical protein